jgi:hypothetical protein
MLAIFLKTPELILTPMEGEQLAQAIATVSELYGPSGMISPETAAWLNLAQVAGLIYGPRVMTARFRKRAQAAQAAAEQSGEWTYGDSTGAQGHPAH